MSDGPKIPVKERHWTEEQLLELIRKEFYYLITAVKNLKTEGVLTPVAIPKKKMVTVTKRFENVNPDLQEDEVNKWLRKNGAQNVKSTSSPNPTNPSLNITTITADIEEEEEKFE